MHTVAVSLPEDETPTVHDGAPLDPSAQTFAFDAPDPAQDAAPRSPDAPPPERYGPPDLLGEGGLGKVFLVRDQVLGRSVAKKVLQDGGPAGVRHRFVRESKITAQLEHPSIIPVYDCGTGEGSLLQSHDGDARCPVGSVALADENEQFVVIAHPDNAISVYRGASVLDGRCTPVAWFPSRRDRLYQLDVTESHILAASWDGEVRVFAVDALSSDRARW
jgi:hypothetical protein